MEKFMNYARTLATQGVREMAYFLATKKFEIVKYIWYDKNRKTGFEPSQQDANVLNGELVH